MRKTESAESESPVGLKDERMTLEIVSRVAEAKGCRPTDLEPLSTVTDPEAIENLLRIDNTRFEVRFEYEGGSVRVSSDGTVEFETGDATVE